MERRARCGGGQRCLVVGCAFCRIRLGGWLGKPLLRQAYLALRPAQLRPQVLSRALLFLHPFLPRLGLLLRAPQLPLQLGKSLAQLGALDVPLRSTCFLLGGSFLRLAFCRGLGICHPLLGLLCARFRAPELGGNLLELLL